MRVAIGGVRFPKSFLVGKTALIFRNLNFAALEAQILSRPLLLFDTSLKSYDFPLYVTTTLWPWPTAPEVSGKPSRGLLLRLLVRDGKPEWRKVFAVQFEDPQNLR